jgi:hypothetical protein
LAEVFFKGLNELWPAPDALVSCGRIGKAHARRGVPAQNALDLDPDGAVAVK